MEGTLLADVIESVSFAGILVLAGVVLWLSVTVIRLRREASINRRVIASLRQIRITQEVRSPWERWVEMLRLALMSGTVVVFLLLLYNLAAG